ncbi:MAG: 3'-5' exonuclease [Ruminococcaceae bacterium]|nr:3'-5' exonuclease [Oscillospiraceae bacterium]
MCSIIVFWVIALIVLAVIAYCFFGWIGVVGIIIILVVSWLSKPKETTKEDTKDTPQALRQENAQVNIPVKRDTEFLNEIASIPSAEIVLGGPKISARTLDDLPSIKFNNITIKTNLNTISDYVVVDIETTGVTPDSKIVELSAIRFENFQPVEKFSTLINPECAIPWQATIVNNITDAMVANAPKIEEVISSYQDFIGARTIVGHNLLFDLKFLYVAGLDFALPKQRLYDTLKLAKTVLPRTCYAGDKEKSVKNYKLGTLCDYYAINVSQAHRACSDCLATGKLFEKLAKAKMQ